MATVGASGAAITTATGATAAAGGTTAAVAGTAVVATGGIILAIALPVLAIGGLAALFTTTVSTGAAAAEIEEPSLSFTSGDFSNSGFESDFAF